MNIKTLLEEALKKSAEEKQKIEDRNVARRSIYRDAVVYLPEFVQVRCIALDISPLGTRVRIERKITLPEFVEVSISGELDRSRVRVVWNDGMDYGLEFSDPNMSPDAYFDNVPWMKKGG